LLSTTYSVVTPIFEAPDELQHDFFVQHLAEREGLAIGAAVINAFNPQFAFISGTITS
jgi:hypothetical protein